MRWLSVNVMSIKAEIIGCYMIRFEPTYGWQCLCEGLVEDGREKKSVKWGSMEDLDMEAGKWEEGNGSMYGEEFNRLIPATSTTHLPSR